LSHNLILGIIAFGIFAGGRTKKKTTITSRIRALNPQTGKIAHSPSVQEDVLGEREERKRQLKAAELLILATGLSVCLYLFLQHKDAIFNAMKDISNKIRIEMTDPETDV
jgi:hypothetical protein